MLFGGFLLHKTNQKAYLWGSWYSNIHHLSRVAATHLEPFAWPVSKNPSLQCRCHRPQNWRWRRFRSPCQVHLLLHAVWQASQCSLRLCIHQLQVSFFGMFLDQLFKADYLQKSRCHQMSLQCPNSDIANASSKNKNHLLPSRKIWEKGLTICVFPICPSWKLEQMPGLLKMCWYFSNAWRQPCSVFQRRSSDGSLFHASDGFRGIHI